MKSDKHLLIILLALYGCAIAVVMVGAGRPTLVQILKAGVNQEWLGFTGAVIGALITAGAGAAAWIAAQRTIATTRTIAQQREDATYRVVQNELVPKVEMFVRYWRIIQRASKSKPEIKRNGVALIRSIAQDGITDAWLDEIRKLGSDLDPLKRRQLIDVLLGLRLVRDQIAAKTDDGDNRAAQFYLFSLRTMLSHFERYLHAFAPLMAQRFEGFTKSAIDHRDLAEHIDPLVESFEKTGTIS